MEELDTIHAQLSPSFVFTKPRRNGTRLYYNPVAKQYLRIGDPHVIHCEYAFHQRLLQQHYPVPALVGQGTLRSGDAYMLEVAVGDEKFGSLFGRECHELGSITPATYHSFIHVVECYVRAQEQQLLTSHDTESLRQGVQIPILISELPEETPVWLALWEKIKHDVDEMPWTLCHGDFNSFNILPGGVIDFEDPFEGPIGYDLMCAITSNSWFPECGDFECLTTIRFTPNHFKQLFDISPQVLDQFDALFLLRAIWAVVRMHDRPKLQAWRYRLFREAVQCYLQGGSLYTWWLAMPRR